MGGTRVPGLNLAYYCHPGIGMRKANPSPDMAGAPRASVAPHGLPDEMATFRPASLFKVLRHEECRLWPTRRSWEAAPPPFYNLPAPHLHPTQAAHQRDLHSATKQLGLRLAAAADNAADAEGVPNPEAGEQAQSLLLAALGLTHRDGELQGRDGRTVRCNVM